MAWQHWPQPEKLPTGFAAIAHRPDCLKQYVTLVLGPPLCFLRLAARPFCGGFFPAFSDEAPVFPETIWPLRAFPSEDPTNFAPASRETQVDNRAVIKSFSNSENIGDPNTKPLATTLLNTFVSQPASLPWTYKVLPLKNSLIHFIKLPLMTKVANVAAEDHDLPSKNLIKAKMTSSLSIPHLAQEALCLQGTGACTGEPELQKPLLRGSKHGILCQMLTQIFSADGL